jgi:hypothetical protein
MFAVIRLFYVAYFKKYNPASAGAVLVASGVKID